ncbi:sigma-70 family RNA polymerase sigma factor [Nocardia cyriacigeorgica]|uniref:Sigma-70 family RNA polymerase sigma factor n=2 Tax=Nocardia cyriacigeorgica TaxID=135487 RepID=A0A6P1CNV6_9NOCA|nr:ECF RNA polymerase sigma factor SigK [Nocardia cyriacigeorgica]MBF6286756.1 ECF RNA polymerase sigma factor SigK [Nocardia cyriacigeorgica]MBF6426134.1 ECF RNA polymerase sigma factor SigK [Nocardia cyriacigeorgica]NEW34168.1 sigma-70 family RNA polymerase sigma factor [Nocardia cyriacigeorgica]CCF65535.1 putative RNA polymerase sigma factor sigK [Nocardia cyriacigeorgica GUH-2]BDU08605.1 RNA polymerase sigma factor SigK [Nocardia cyriacigeorgica]
MTRDPGFIPFVGPVLPDDLSEAPACPARHGNGEVRRRLDGLLKSTAAGDREAFTHFYRETSPRVFGLALRVLRSPTAAEETTQEVFLQVWSSAERYDPALSSPIGWLMMITHRRAVDRVRSESSAAGRDAVYGHTHLGRDHDIVAETVGQRMDEQAVRDCLDTLTATQREALALAYYSGRTYREVADHLASPLPTIKSRIRDGLKRLQDCLTGVTP